MFLYLFRLLSFNNLKPNTTEFSVLTKTDENLPRKKKSMSLATSEIRANFRSTEWRHEEAARQLNVIQNGGKKMMGLNLDFKRGISYGSDTLQEFKKKVSHSTQCLLLIDELKNTWILEWPPLTVSKSNNSRYFCHTFTSVTYKPFRAYALILGDIVRVVLTFAIILTRIAVTWISLHCIRRKKYSLQTIL